MAAMLDQSLDAMIKETRKTQPKRRPMQKKQMGGKKNAQGANARASSAGPAPMSITSGGVRKTTAISKKVARVSANATAMAVDRMPRQNDNRARPSAATPASKTQLIVSNLDWKVTDQDIKELFGQVGRVFSAGVNYGPDGRSKGTANVSLGSYDQALKAVQTYNGVKLDGRPLNISIVGAPPAQPVSITQRLSGLKQPMGKPMQNKPVPKATPNRGNATAKVLANVKGAASGQKKKVLKKKVPKSRPAVAKATAADLDAQLDSYKATADVQMT